jgi:hypothetical protein
MSVPGPLSQQADIEAIPRWWGDVLPGAHYSDRIWGNAIRSAELLESGVGRDRVLHGLMTMGVVDWSKPNEIGSHHQEVMCHGTAMAVRITKRLYTLEDRVGPSLDLS